MMQSKMKKLALAVGLGLGGLALIPSTQAMNLATDGLGQVLIFPYYTVRGGWTTLFNITNTSDQIVAAKVRFHESYNSRDVFDFNVVMSPHDVWNGWVVDNGDGPSFHTEDKTCTTMVNVPVDVAQDGVPFYAPDLGIDGTIAYTGSAADGGPTDITRMNEGYVEVIMMGSSIANIPAQAPGSDLILGAVHDKGTPPGCDRLATAFLTYPGTFGTDSFATLQAYFSIQAGLNPLKGSYNLVNASKGWTASGSPTTIANFVTSTLFAPTSLMTTTLPPGGGVPFNLSFLEPSLNSGNTRPIGTGPTDGALPALPATTGGVNAVSTLLARTHVINQWTRITQSSSAWVTASDSVLTFPTKAFYVDNWPASNFSARAAARSTAAAGSTIPVVVPAIFPTPFTQTFDDSTTNPVTRRGSANIDIPFSIYNREEIAQTGAGISPGTNRVMLYEANVLTFGVPGSAGTNILASANPRGITPLPGDSGYFDILLTAANATNIPQGLPVISFGITSRDTGDGTLNEAFLIDAAYSRSTTGNP